MIQQSHLWVYIRVSKRYLNIQVQMALFTKVKRWKQPQYPLADKWINKIWYIHTMQYYSTLNRKEILTCYSVNEH